MRRCKFGAGSCRNFARTISGISIGLAVGNLGCLGLMGKGNFQVCWGIWGKICPLISFLKFFRSARWMESRVPKVVANLAGNGWISKRNGLGIGPRYGSGGILRSRARSNGTTDIDPG